MNPATGGREMVHFHLVADKYSTLSLSDGALKEISISMPLLVP